MRTSTSTKSANPACAVLNKFARAFRFLPAFFKIAKTGSASVPSFSAVFSRGSRSDLSIDLQEFLPLFRPAIFFRRKKIGPEFAVADSDDEIFFGETESAQDVDAKRDKIDICICVGDFSPMMSQLSWKCSRNRPRCCFS